MKKVLVVGASLNPMRYNNIAIHRLVKSGILMEAYDLKLGTFSNSSNKDQIFSFSKH